jgi:hypothetical protein
MGKDGIGSCTKRKKKRKKKETTLVTQQQEEATGTHPSATLLSDA